MAEMWWAAIRQGSEGQGNRFVHDEGDGDREYMGKDEVEKDP